ncbi:MAG TPA: glycosyl hydrolase family 79 C-terminal domain-containing protein, partial [Rhizomicrobium sp.]|nr:glycosyl hydrolase family 79 C-terminal domain-containing protein [Rhizomicrobium sp.]
SAIRAVLPGAPFAGPDIAMASLDWMQSFARDEAGDIALLTAHHYITGQANPAATIETLLREDKNYQPVLAKYQAATDTARVPWRMSETSSFYGGGKAGVSDTFASALWALDYLFVLAAYGASGVNMETGVNHLGVVSKYTPITDDLAGHYGAAPEYYGLLAFAQAAKGEQIALDCNAGSVNLNAYATRQGSQLTLTVINKDMSRDASVAITGMVAKQARAMRLSAPSLPAASGITLGGAPVDGGKWSGGKSDPVKLSGGKAMLEVPCGSAALVTLSA